VWESPPNRDRFVLSNGHASMLLWSVLHLTKTQAVDAEYENLGHPSVSLDDIRRFRQIDSRAPGHPEYHWVSGVETTTGPLGQGVATSVGMAVAQKWIASRYNKPGFPILDYNIYAVCGGPGLFLLFVLEAAKTMVQSYGEFTKKLAERHAAKLARKQAAAKTHGAQ
jgi:transketolase